MGLGNIHFIVIINNSGTGPIGKTEIVKKLYSQPHKHLRHGKLEETLLKAATYG